MRLSDFLICLIHARGKVQGRTQLQKTAFFVSKLAGLGFDEEFLAHYYGPYSPSLDSSLAQIKNMGFLDEQMIGFGVADNTGFEVRRFDYQLTEDGNQIAGALIKKYPSEYEKITKSLQLLRDAGNPNYFELSIAAKAYFILNEKGGPMSRGEIAAEAKKFDWNIQPQSLETAIQFLEKIGLTTAP